MADPYHVDPDGSNTSPYDTWATAATDLQTVVNLMVDGDTAYCRGTQILTSGGTATIDMTSLAGTIAGGMISIIGCNSAGVDDGTYFVLDGANANGAGGINPTGMDGVYLKNIRVTRCQGDGIAQGTSAYTHNCFLENILLDSNTGNGLAGQGYFKYSVLYKVLCYQNGGYGFYKSNSTSINLFCQSINNSSDGLYSPSGGLFYGCIFGDNGSEGIGYAVGSTTYFLNSVIDGNTSHGIDGYYNPLGTVAVGCRITNNGGYGIRNTDSVDHFGSLFNYFYGNTSGAKSGLFITSDDTTNGTSDGYNNAATYDYNLTASADDRDVEVTLQSVPS